MKAIQDKEISSVSKDSDQFNKEVANICLMGLEDEFIDNKINFSYYECLVAFQELYDEFKTLMSKHTLLKKNNIKHFNKVQQFALDNDTLKFEKNLTIKVNIIKSNVDFSTSINKLKNENELLKRKFVDLIKNRSKDYCRVISESYNLVNKNMEKECKVLADAIMHHPMQLLYFLFSHPFETKQNMR